MKWEMEILSPPVSSMSWSSGDGLSSRWTVAENKLFENALAIFDTDTPDRWQKVAAMIPGKTVGDVIRQYKELEADVSSIEAGLIPIPGYDTSQFTLDWVSSHSYDGFKQSYGLIGKRSSGRSADQERKKGVPWTEEEHKLFLMGLKKYGKGDWRNISRNFVVTRTPTQVASHAQKYFIRQLSGGKDKRRASIHDITTVNLNDTRSPSPENKKSLSPDHAGVLSRHSNPSSTVPRNPFNWNHHQQQQQHNAGGAAMVFNHSHGNVFMSPGAFGVNSYVGVRLPDHNLQKGAVNEPFIGPQNMIFQMQAGHCFPHG
ncbi:transcription factor DIVARICATA isoform X1 [Cucurbita pepo subsp. pepo]|uniref:transcription factor DIVARICATA isoform X1 n=1 Tax=Cucurbita pepo subsp. pepo TaxID=3664 RepID=UPI000C9D565E|nr:transcription factor DIVARICATA isoform X1 [Cucurbita pepo subsp. pepo]